MIKEEEEEKKEAAGAAAIIWDCGSPLYDSFELVSLVNYIERHMMFMSTRNCDIGGIKSESRYGCILPNHKNTTNSMSLWKKMKVRKFHRFFFLFW